jgi:hypothetical protein
VFVGAAIKKILKVDAECQGFAPLALIRALLRWPVVCCFQVAVWMEEES